MRCIHLNPVRAKLVADPAEHDWSGHLAYLGKAHKAWLTTDWVLSQFASSTSTARFQFEAFVHAGLHEGRREEFHRERLEGAILGEDNFVEKIISHQTTLPSRRISLDAIMQAVAAAWEVSQDALQSSSRVRALAKARFAAAYLVTEYGADTLSTLGRLLRRDVSTLSAGARAIRSALPKDPI